MLAFLGRAVGSLRGLWPALPLVFLRNNGKYVLALSISACDLASDPENVYDEWMPQVRNARQRQILDT